jgi:hypothetical protein
MAQRKASFSRTTRVQSPTVAMADDVPDAEAEKWIAQWACVLAKGESRYSFRICSEFYPGPLY